jgi:hypothetical protein
MNAFRPLAVAVALAAFCTVASAQFEGMKGKMKEGLYDYKMEMDMGNIPGMPPGMSRQAHSFQQCITAKDIEKGGFQRGKEGKMPENCEVRDFKMSGNTASYTWECKGEEADEGRQQDDVPRQRLRHGHEHVHDAARASDEHEAEDAGAPRRALPEVNGPALLRRRRLRAVRGGRRGAGTGSAPAPSPAPAAGGKGLLLGKVKPGLYENQVTSELSGLPGVPAEQQKSTETQHKCVTPADIDKGIDLPAGCTIKTLDETASGMHATAECRDGSTSEFRIAATDSGFSSEFKSTGMGATASPSSRGCEPRANTSAPANRKLGTDHHFQRRTYSPEIAVEMVVCPRFPLT